MLLRQYRDLKTCIARVGTSVFCDMSLTQKHKSIKAGTDINNDNIKINYISATFMLVMVMSIHKQNHVRHS